MGQVRSQSKVGFGQVGECLSSKESWRYWAKRPRAQQYRDGRHNLVEVALKSQHSLGLPMDSEICEQYPHRG